MTSPGPEIGFEEFLRQLAAQRGTARKLRFAARYWKKLERLPDSERQRVALVLGSEAAWKQLERLFLRDGTLSDEERLVQQALDRLGGADPAELRRWAGALRSGDTRQVGKLLSGAVQAALEQEADELPPTDGADEPPPAGDDERRPAQGDAPADNADEPPPSDHEVEVAPPSDPRETSTVGARVAAPVDLPAAVTRVDPVIPEPSAPPSSPTPRTGSPPQEAPAVGSRATPSPSARSGYQRPTAMTASQRLRELRELRRNPAGVAALGAEGRAALVARLGPGWAARRAVSAMIRSGAVAGVDEALRLIADLDTPTRRNWCLGVLLDSFDLTESERQQILEAVPSPAARRRLARRSGA